MRLNGERYFRSHCVFYVMYSYACYVCLKNRWKFRNTTILGSISSSGERIINCHLLTVTYKNGDCSLINTKPSIELNVCIVMYCPENGGLEIKYVTILNATFLWTVCVYLTATWSQHIKMVSIHCQQYHLCMFVPVSMCVCVYIQCFVYGN